MPKNSILIIILFSVFLFSCQQVQEKKNDEYFEGFVEANINISSPSQNVINNFKHIYGEKLITYINKKGFYSREFIDSNNIIVSKEVYNPDSLRLYFFTGNDDTVKYYDVTKNDIYEIFL